MSLFAVGAEVRSHVQKVTVRMLGGAVAVQQHLWEGGAWSLHGTCEVV